MMCDLLLSPHMKILSKIIFLKKTRAHIAYYICIVFIYSTIRNKGANNIKRKSSRFERQIPGAQVPDDRCQVPGVEVLGARYQVPVVRYQVCRFQVSGVKCQMSGAKSLVSGVRCLAPGVGCQVSGISGTRYLGTMCQVFWIRCYVEMTKTFTLKTAFPLVESTNVFYVSTEITDTYRHIFHLAHIFII